MLVGGAARRAVAPAAGAGNSGRAGQRSASGATEILAEGRRGADSGFRRIGRGGKGLGGRVTGARSRIAGSVTGFGP